MHSELITCLDKIVSYLSCGEAWHRRVANECRKLGVRGMGRWHDAEAVGDQKILSALQKELRDYLKHAPAIDSTTRAKSEEVTMEGLKCFQAHFNIWLDREKQLCHEVTLAIGHMREVNITIYRTLLDLKEEVQNEMFRLEHAFNSFQFAGWEGHDITVKSKWIHDYFEKDYDGGCIDFNIG